VNRLYGFAVAMALAGSPMAAQAGTYYQDLYDFAGAGGDGGTPYADLVADSLGRLYGTTYSGGNFQGGTVFRLTLPATKTGAATLEILHSFQGPEGANPFAGLLIGADGAIYGTAQQGGAHSRGTVFRLDPATLAVTDLHDFNPGAKPPDGSDPVAALVAGPNGLLYGTTGSDGANRFGVAFAISPQGDAVSYTVIHAFGAGDGNNPYGRLVSSGNNLFGITNAGGKFGAGTAFELSLAKSGKWKETGLYPFGANSQDVLGPSAALVLGKAGILYGCAQDGSFGRGGVFAITPGKGGAPMAEQVIYDFGANANDPYDNSACALSADKTGRLVGITSGGGNNLSGSVFTLTPGGGGWTLAVPYSFGIRANGAATGPQAPVIGVKGGYYVGTTPVGGAHDQGAAYRVTF
jgi:uncharacterized repeat protein (TIGR03803 family)